MAAQMNLFALLEYLDTQKLDVYSSLSEDSDLKKELDKNISWYLPMWFVGAVNQTNQQRIIEDFNEHGNQIWNDISDNPELQHKLLASIGIGKKIKHKFYKPKAKTKKSAIEAMLQLRYIDIRADEVLMWCKHNTLESVRTLAERFGYNKTDMSQVIKDFKATRK